MNPHHWQIKRFITIVFCAIIATLIASSTIGREIYRTGQVSIFSFGIVNFSGYLFFLIMPVELAFIYCLHSQPDIVLLNMVAILTAISAQLIDYYTGRFFSTNFIDKLVGRHRFERAENKIRQYGNIVIFLFNLLPLSSPVILLAAGMIKHPVKQAIFYSLLGLLSKQLFMTLIFL